MLFYCALNGIYLVHNALLCFVPTFMDFSPGGNGGDLVNPARDGGSGLRYSTLHPAQIPPRHRFLLATWLQAVELGPCLTRVE